MDIELTSKSWLNKDQIVNAVNKAKVSRLARCAALVEGEAKRKLSRGGKMLGTAKFGDKKVPVKYQSGPAGQPPRLRSGNLRASVKYAQVDENTYIVGPTTTAWYGRVHEFGAKIIVTSKMHFFLGLQLGIWVPIGATIIIPKRPFMSTALQAVVDKFPEQFKDLPLGGTAI